MCPPISGNLHLRVVQNRSSACHGAKPGAIPPPGLLRQAQGVREFGEDQRRDCQGHQNGPNKEGTPGHILQLSLGIIGVRSMGNRHTLYDSIRP